MQTFYTRLHKFSILSCAYKMRQNITIEIICFLLILLFVYAAVSKLLDYSSLESQFQNSPVLSPFHSFAWLLPVVELVTAAMLSIKSFRLEGLYIAFTLLMAFTIYIIFMLLFVKHLPCSCGGVLKYLSWKQHIVFNGFFLFLSGTGIYYERKYKHVKNIVV